MSGRSTALKIENLSFGYQKNRPIYKDFSLTVQKGELVSIVGPSGSGKSTLFDLICGFRKPSGGNIEVGSLSYIFQDPNSSFHPGYSIREQIAEVSREPIDEAVLQDRLGVEPRLLDVKPFELSGGQLQRFSIFRALQMRPLLLLADEPTSALDNLVQLGTMKLLVSLLEDCAILLVTHDESLAAWCSDKIVRLEKVA